METKYDHKAQIRCGSQFFIAIFPFPMAEKRRGIAFLYYKPFTDQCTDYSYQITSGKEKMLSNNINTFTISKSEQIIALFTE